MIVILTLINSLPFIIRIISITHFPNDLKYITCKEVKITQEFKNWFIDSNIWYALIDQEYFKGHSYTEDDIWALIEALLLLSLKDSSFSVRNIFNAYCKTRGNNILNMDQESRLVHIALVLKFLLLLKIEKQLTQKTSQRVGKGKTRTLVMLKLDVESKIAVAARQYLCIKNLGVVVKNENVSIKFDSNRFPVIRRHIEKKLNDQVICINKSYRKWLEENVIRRKESFRRQPVGKIKNKNYAFLKEMFDELRFVRNDFDDGVNIKFINDFRGRIYPNYRSVSYISHPIFRTVFELKPLTKGNDEIVLERTLGIINKLCKRNYISVNEAFDDMSDDILDKYKQNPSDYWFLKFFQLNKKVPIIQLDARCRGFQHFACLINSSKLGSILSLGSEDGGSKDLYQEVFDVLLTLLETQEEKQCIDNYLNKGLRGRNLMKKPIIAYLYGASFRTIHKYLAELLDPNRFTEGFTIEKSLVDKVKTAIQQVAPELKVVITHFKKAVRIRRNDYMYLPDGFPIPLSYREIKLIDTTVYYKSKKFHFQSKLPIKEFDLLKRKRAAFVNLIHGLDALHMCYIIEICPAPLLPLHDCLIFNLADYDVVKDVPKEAYARLYSDNEVFGKIIDQLKYSTNPEDKKVEQEAREFIKSLVNEYNISPHTNCFKLAHP